MKSKGLMVVWPFVDNSKSTLFWTWLVQTQFAVSYTHKDHINKKCLCSALSSRCQNIDNHMFHSWTEASINATTLMNSLQTQQFIVIVFDLHGLYQAQHHGIHINSSYWYHYVAICSHSIVLEVLLEYQRSYQICIYIGQSTL